MSTTSKEYKMEIIVIVSYLKWTNVVQTISKQKEEEKIWGLKNIRLEPNQNVNDLEKTTSHLSS